MLNLRDEITKTNEVKIISFKTGKNINTDNIEEAQIMEYQIELHDFKDLGQVVADAVMMNLPIGIMATFQMENDEYVAAITWLNKTGQDKTSFFLLRPKESQTDELIFTRYLN